MLYDLSLHMGYTYDTLAHGARHIIRVLPLSIPGRQRLVAGSIDVSPVPEERATFEDFFHQSATSVHLRAPHEKLDIRMQARVMVEAPALTADFSPELSACRRTWPMSGRSISNRRTTSSVRARGSEWMRQYPPMPGNC